MNVILYKIYGAARYQLNHFSYDVWGNNCTKYATDYD